MEHQAVDRVLHRLKVPFSLQTSFPLYQVMEVNLFSMISTILSWSHQCYYFEKIFVHCRYHEKVPL